MKRGRKGVHHMVGAPGFGCRRLLNRYSGGSRVIAEGRRSVGYACGART